MQIQDVSTLWEQKDHDIENNGNNNVYICSLTKAGTWARMRKTKSWRTALRLAAVESWGERRRQRVKNPRAKKFILLVKQRTKNLPSQGRHLSNSLISRPTRWFLNFWLSDFCVDQLWAAQFWTTVHNDLCQSSTQVRSSDSVMNRQAGLRRKACFAFQLFSFWSSNPLQIILILSLTVRFLPKLLRCGSPYKGKPNWLVKRHWLWFDLKPQCLCRFQMFPGYEGQLTKSWPALAGSNEACFTNKKESVSIARPSSPVSIQDDEAPAGCDAHSLCHL